MSDIAAEIVGSNQPATDGTDSVSSFSFENLHAQALEKFGNDTPPVVPGEQVAQPDASAVSAEAEVTKIEPDATVAQVTSLKDTDLVEVEVDGEKLTMPWSEARGGVMRQAAFTKRMQGLAREREQIQQQQAASVEATQQRDALLNLVKDEALLRQFLQVKYPNLLQQAQAADAAAAQVDPDDIATVGQIRAAQAEANAQIQQTMQQMQAALAQEAESITQRIEDRAATAKLSSEINSTIEGLFAEHPHLEKLIPNANELLRYEVLKLKPQTPADTLAAFKQVFSGWVENYQSTVTATNKTAVIQKNKLVTGNIQPPGGAAVTPAPADFKKVNKMTGKTELDWDKMRAAALAKMGS